MEQPVVTGRPERKHILFVLEYFYPHVGGVEILFRHLTEALVAEGNQVTVITLRLPGTPTHEWLNGVEIVRIRTLQTARRYLFMLCSLPAVLRHARRADLIHTTLYNAAIPGWVGSLIARRPVVLTVHEVFGDQWHALRGMNPVVGAAFRAFEWAVLHLPFAYVLCDSHFTERRLRRFTRVPATRTSVAYPAVDYDFWDPARHRARDLRAELGFARDAFIYLYFGRPGISKGVEYLIDAAPMIRDALPNSHLVMLLAQDPLGPYRRILRTVDDGHLTRHVTVLDPVPREELPSYLLAANCVVVPSVSEGFGYSAVEAATIGCPVIATSGHSVEEVLEGCVRLVPPRDPEAIARAVIAFARQRPVWSKPRRYDTAEHIHGVRNAYRRVWSRRRPNAQGERSELRQEVD